MMCEIITIGTELTHGLAVDTNTARIARKLAGNGILCQRAVTIPDDTQVISATLKESMKRTDLTIMTGGLGPTADDVTRESLAEATSQKLIKDPLLAEALRHRLRQGKTKTTESIDKQTYRPKNSRIIMPILGTAPGIVIERGKKTVVALPGVPREMSDMLDREVSNLRKKYGLDAVYVTRIIKLSGASEAEIEERVRAFIERAAAPTVTILASIGEVHLLLTQPGRSVEEARATLAQIESEIIERLGDLVFGFDDETLEQVIGRKLLSRRLKLAVAESCTGGLLAKRLTDVPGASAYFLGSIVAYGNDVKTEMLGLAPKMLLEQGAVSPSVALELANGARNRMSADIGLSITGIAGPDGGSEEKPVGTTFIAMSAKADELCERFDFLGNRWMIRAKAAQTALNILRAFIGETFEPEDEIS